MLQPRGYYTNLVINNISEYDDLQYSFDYITVITIVTTIYSFLSFLITLKMCYIYKKLGNKVLVYGLHPIVFKLFNYMQLWNTAYIVTDLIINRVPSTTIFTKYCHTFPHMEYFMGAQFLTYYASTFFTLMFCVVRFLIVWSPRNHEHLCEKTSQRFTPISVILSIFIGIPISMGQGVCVQLDEPYQFGAVVINCTVVYKNQITTICHVVGSSIIIFIIFLLSTYMLCKLRANNETVSSTRNKERRKAEKTLTVTMFLIFIPLFLSLSMRALDITRSSLYPYVMITRPLFVDTRVNLVSFYFYMTHPLFQKPKSKTSTVTVVKSNSELI